MSDELLKLLIKYDITPNDFVLIKCIAENNRDLLMEYMGKFGTYNLPHIFRLVKMGFLDIPGGRYDESNVYFEDISVTDKVEKIFKDNLQLQESQPIFEDLWNELLSNYPKIVNGRRLHVEKATCKKLYKSIINPKPNEYLKDVHNLIIKCIRYEINERKKSGNINFMWQLPRYIRQRGWETYKEEVINLEGEISASTEDQIEDI